MRYCWTLNATAILSLAFTLAATSSGSASSFKVIHTFGTSGLSDAGLPVAGLIRDAAGNLYGTTVAGGPQNGGTVFELSPSSNGTWKETILYSFTSGADGGAPVAGVVLDSAGNIYGTTQQGGISSSNCGSGWCGVVFELVKANRWKETVLYSFTGAADGASPAAPVLLDSAGNIYGTASGGGTFVGCYFGCGVVFELDKANAYTEKVLHTFTGFPTDGNNPTAGLQFQGNNLVGTTVAGGVGPCCGGYDGGVIFQLVPDSSGTWNENILYTFCAQTLCADGSMPSGGVVVQNGNLYGATSNGGTAGGYGVVYTMPQSGGSKLREFSFGGSGGENPVGPPLLRQGHIFGVTEQGGTMANSCAPFQNGNGVVYELAENQGKQTETVLHSFTGGDDGCIPQGNLIASPAGSFYGTTYLGGRFGLGVVFEVTQ